MALAQIACCLLCLTGTASATTPAVQQKPYPVITEIKKGVKTITNPDYPRDGRYFAKLTVEMSCGEEGGPQAGILKFPLGLEIDEHGDVFVTDMKDADIKVYDSQGRYLRTIGRKGQGPGEFGGMVSCTLISGNRLCILDGSQFRIMFMTTEGRYLSGFRLEGYFRDLAVDDKDRIYLSKWEAAKQPDGPSDEFQEIPYVTGIYLAEVSGKELVHLRDFFGESVPMRLTGSGEVTMSMGLGYEIVWSVGREGKFYGGCNGDYNLGVFGSDGKQELAFGRHHTPIKNARYKGLIGQKKTMGAYRAIVVEEDGDLWVELIQAEGAKGTLYDVFSPDGVYLKQIEIGQKISRFKNGKIYSILRPEEGYPSIKRYNMELAPAGK